MVNMIITPQSEADEDIKLWGSSWVPQGKFKVSSVWEEVHGPRRSLKFNKSGHHTEVL